MFTWIRRPSSQESEVGIPDPTVTLLIYGNSLWGVHYHTWPSETLCGLSIKVSAPTVWWTLVAARHFHCTHASIIIKRWPGASSCVGSRPWTRQPRHTALPLGQVPFMPIYGLAFRAVFACIRQGLEHRHTPRSMICVLIRSAKSVAKSNGTLSMNGARIIHILSKRSQQNSCLQRFSPEVTTKSVRNACPPPSVL